MRRAHLSLAAAAALAAAVALPGCAAVRDSLPGCHEPLRLAVIAQSVPGAAYVPCLRRLPQGWNSSAFDATSGGTSFLLNSDRSPGKPVRVRLAAGCDVAGASPFPARSAGVLSYLRLASTSPRYAGILYDVFPGGCVRYDFDFQLGPNISLMEDLRDTIGLYPRHQLRIVVKNKLGVELDP